LAQCNSTSVDIRYFQHHYSAEAVNSRPLQAKRQSRRMHCHGCVGRVETRRWKLVIIVRPTAVAWCTQQDAVVLNESSQ